MTNRDPDDWREHYKKTLAGRFLLRVHMSLILLGAVSTGFMTSVLLVDVGLTAMGPRWGLAVLAAWLAFFILIRIWLVYLTRGAVRHSVDVDGMALDAADAATYGLGHDAAVDPPPARAAPGVFTGGAHSTSASTGGSSSSSSADDGAAAVIIVVVVAAVVAVLLGTAIYFVWEAPAILGEAAVELVLAASIARSARRIDRPGWSGSVLRATWKPMLAVLTIVTIGGYVVQGVCPGPITLSGAIAQCT